MERFGGPSVNLFSSIDLEKPSQLSPANSIRVTVHDVEMYVMLYNSNFLMRLVHFYTDVFLRLVYTWFFVQKYYKMIGAFTSLVKLFSFDYYL